MFRLFFTPVWFNGWDIVFNIVSIVVALFIAGYSYKMFKVNKENKFGYFSLAFLLIAVSLILQSFSSGVLYFTPVRDVVANVLAPATGVGLKYSDLFYRAAFFVQMASMLGALLLIFFISQKSRKRLNKFYEVSQIALFVYLIILISIFSNFKFFVFYITSMVLLGLIVLNYYKNYLNKDKNKNAWMVMIGFLLMFFGNLFFVFVFLSQSLYAVGQVFILMGFLFLLYVYRRAIRRTN